MILEFSVTNFRSIHQKQIFSMLASATKSKSENTFTLKLSSGEEVVLVKTAGIYGANASGKSNLIHALFNFMRMIKTSADLKVDEPIKFYDPFLFNDKSKELPTEFELIFVGKDENKYKYNISFNKQEIIAESLDYYPKKKSNNVFKRLLANGELVHTAKLGKDFGNKSYEMYRNQLFLSKVGKDIPNLFLAGVYLYFDTIDIWNVSELRVALLKKIMIDEIKKIENDSLMRKLKKLIKIADTKIDDLVLHQIKEDDLPNDLPEELKKKIAQSNEELYAKHFIYNDDKNNVGSHDLSFKQESVGTNYLFSIGGLILQKLEKGGIVVFDEFDNSLHPLLSRFLVQLCNSPISNPNKLQLIFMSHEPTLIDKNSMRADQIWFANKNNFGETEFYSAQYFDGVREDIPFDKWYLAGKFGAIPKINESDIHLIFEDEAS